MLTNCFRFVRAVFFALLSFFTILSFSFAILHGRVLSNAGVDGPTASTVTIFESAAMFVCILFSLGEVIYPKVTTSLVIVEFSWTLILSFIQLGCAVGSVLEGSCGPSGDTSVCGSATLYAHAIWLKVLVSWAYFLTFLITILSHRTLVKGIFSQSIREVDWFNCGQAGQTHQIYLGKNLTWEKGRMDDVESLGSQKQFPGIAPWAKESPVRRGVDAPFAVTPIRSPATSPARSKILPALPALRMSTPRPFSATASRFVERFRESRIVSRRETPSEFGKYMVKRESSFPPILDHDKPIPKPVGCEWLRADALHSAH